MAHRNVHPALTAIMDSTLAYRDLRPGETLHIHARDARTGSDGVLRLQVIAVLPFGKNGLHKVVFRFLGSNFALYRRANEPVVVPEGTFAEGGVSATLVPQLVLSMVGMDGIGLGRDWALDWVGGEEFGQLAVHRLSRIEREDPPPGWQPPTGELTAYLACVAAAEEADFVRRADREGRLKRPMTVRTRSDSVYHLGPADDAGRRTLSKEGSTDELRGVLIALSLGGAMAFQREDGKTLTTSQVVAIEPSPDEEEAT